MKTHFCRLAVEALEDHLVPSTVAFGDFNNDGLMDQAAPPETLSRIRELIAINAEGAIEAHDLRTRHAGRVTFVDFHLVVPGQLPVSEAHDICDRLERALKSEVEGALITIHVEPENKAKHQGIIVV